MYRLDEAIKIMLMERKMSNKINYDVLRSLTSTAVDGADAPATLLSGKEDSTVNDSEPVTVIESGPVVPPTRKRTVTESELEGGFPAPAPAKKSKAVQKIKSEVKTESKVDISKIHLKDAATTEPTEEAQPVVVESGPVEAEDYEEESKDGRMFFSFFSLSTSTFKLMYMFSR